LILKKTESSGINAGTSDRGWLSNPDADYLFCCTCAGCIVATLIARNIARALGGEPKEASAIARSIASGDLSIDIQVDARDQTSVLSAMKEMRDSLVSIVGARVQYHGYDFNRLVRNRLRQSGFICTHRTASDVAGKYFDLDVRIDLDRETKCG
jgi:hypothetical protein